MVFQNYALYQHMSVYDNLAFGLRNKKTSEAEIKAAIDRAAGMLGLHDLMQRKPKQLSGGQQQRVALGRCIVRNPQVFLFDEPLSNLDAKLRAQMRIEIKRLHAAIPTTSVFVTHDQVEAMTLGDRVVIMRDGRVQQVGTPLQVYGKPANKFVAGFIGAPAMNFVDVTVRADAGATAVEAAGLKLTIGAADARALAPYNGRPVIMGVRPEHLALGEGAPGLNFDARVDVIEQLGSEILLETRVGNHSVTVARVRAGDEDRQRRSGPPLGAARPAAFLRSGDRVADYGLISYGGKAPSGMRPMTGSACPPLLTAFIERRWARRKRSFAHPRSYDESSPLHRTGRRGKPFHGPDALLQPPAIFRRPILEFAVDAEIMGPVMGDVGIVLGLPADRDQIGLAFLQDRFRLLGLEDDADRHRAMPTSLRTRSA